MREIELAGRAATPYVCGMLTETELTLINEAMRRYAQAPAVITCSNPDVIARLYPEVIPALGRYGTNPALELAFDLVPTISEV